MAAKSKLNKEILNGRSLGLWDLYSNDDRRTQVNKRTQTIVKIVETVSDRHNTHNLLINVFSHRNC
jgi:hypothetical protein